MKTPFTTLCLASTLVFAIPASAQVLMLDFGPTAAANPTSSPYHSANPQFTDSTWNVVGTNDVKNGSLKWSNGSTNTASAEIQLDLGATTSAGVTTIGLGNAPSNGTGLTGSAINGGVYANTAARDGIFTGDNNGHSRYIGLQIGGLGPGTYEIYITGRNTNTTAGHTQTFYAGKSATGGDFDVANTAVFASQTLTYFASPTDQNNGWQAYGTSLANYAKFSITLSAGEFIQIAVTGGSGELRGFLNSVQIVNTSAIPEPSVFGIIAGTGVLFVACVRRRSRNLPA